MKGPATKMKRYVNIIGAVWYLLLGAGIFVLVALAVFLGLRPADQLPLGRLVFEFTSPGVQINMDNKLVSEFSKPALLSMGLNLVATWLLLLYSVRQLLNMFKSFRQQSSPFSADNVHRLKRISYSFFLYSALLFILGIVLDRYFQQPFLLPGTEQIWLSIQTSIPFWPIVCGVFAIGIAEIFHYGLTLQQDNDSIV